MGKKYAKGRKTREPAPINNAEASQALRTALGYQKVRSDINVANVEILCLGGSTLVTIDGKEYILKPAERIRVTTRG